MHSFRINLAILCALFALRGASQNQIKADSIRQVIENQRLNSSEILEAYYWLSAYSSSPEEELRYAKQLLEFAERANNKEFVVKANFRIGVAQRLLGNSAIALEHLFESANDAQNLSGIASLLSEIYSEISTCYTQVGDSENALLYGSKTIQILRKTDRKQELALTLLNMGYDYYLIANYDSAMAYYNESEPLLKEIDMTIGLAYLIGNRALVYWKNGDNNRAKKDLYKAIEMLEPYEDRYGMADYYNQLGNIYLEENAPQDALKHLETSLTMAMAEGMKEQIRDAYFLMFTIHQNAGNHTLALEHQTQYYLYKDSIQNLETAQQLAKLRTAYEVGQKQAEVDLLLEQNRKDQIIIITGGIILIILVCLMILTYSFLKSKTRLNKQLEEQKDTLVALNNTKDKFFSIISHDLRGPVGVLSGLVSVSKYVVSDQKNDQLKEMLDKMEMTTDRLVKLLDNLLHWALQQRGHFPYVPENLSVKDILLEETDMFKDMAASKNIDLEVRIEEDLSAYIDKHTTSTIFRNLLNNAIKFTPDGGNIQVTANKDGEAKMSVIKIIDNGVGMPQEKLNILFKLNENITTRGTSGETGLGLGLQLVYDFVKMNKGEIKVQSEEGKGTTFSVYLPLI